MERFQRWIVVSHEKPDGDTLGCGSAVSSILRSMGKKVVWCGPSEMPRIYSFFSSAGEYIRFLDPRDVRLSLGDEPVGWFFLDHSDFTRAMERIPRVDEDVVVNVDHHGDNSFFGDYNWVDPSAAAVGEMVARMFRDLHISLSAPIATDLYVAIATDTGSFRFSSVTPATFDAAAFLLSQGVDLAFVDDVLNRSMDEGILRLWGKALCRVSASDDGLVVVSWLDEDDFRQCGCGSASTEGLVNLIFSTPRAMAGALISRDGGDISRVSLRTRRPVSAREIATLFGGGGHERAAGFRLKTSPAEGARMLLRELVSHVLQRISSDR
ncbi:MAG: bifunctional oligoribonuclease/PAP phosphatase NrnA [Thermanaerothrix sp.]|nr:bifunctional oligoribonuclease/PAP phosphatase NrnA [Thermanaerothrix sp.]